MLQKTLFSNTIQDMEKGQVKEIAECIKDLEKGLYENNSTSVSFRPELVQLSKIINRLTRETSHAERKDFKLLTGLQLRAIKCRDAKLEKYCINN